jgi:hypothetical protein
MSKLKRKVTVDNPHSTQEDNDRRKPSVFERLGPGAAGASRKYEDNVRQNLSTVNTRLAAKKIIYQLWTFYEVNTLYMDLL